MDTRCHTRNVKETHSKVESEMRFKGGSKGGINTSSERISGFYAVSRSGIGRGRKKIVPETEYIEKMEILHVKENKDSKVKQLKVTKIDFCVEENSKAHRTDEYEIKNLIVRRGQVFKMSVTFNRPVDEQKDQIILQLATGSHPKQSKKTIIRMKNTGNFTTESWGMRIVKQEEAVVEMSVMSPADAFVGRYTVYLETKTKGHGGKDEVERHQEEKKIYVLFNAWCEDDSVYMENEDDRKEYVLEDHGRIWRGTSDWKSGLAWNFGQFEPVSLETCLNLLDMANVEAEARGDPVRVSRVMSKMVNSNDDDGVLVGRWDGEYEDGASPTSWAGSVAILEEYATSKKPVKYGQCWVFSALVTTLLRAIGIPTRSVTNFDSAHDVDKSLTIDYHVAEDGTPLSHLNDSIWNYHVWNESYLARPDLPSGYEGWQAHDATPQEKSEGVFQCGPCPVTAIKNGEVYLPYDAGFIFAEVNGDKISWVVDEQGDMTISRIDAKSVGQCISTKAVGSNEREDLTNMYKFSDGSEEERNAVRMASQFSSRKDEDIHPPEKLRDIDIKVQCTKVMIGQDAEVKLEVKNTCGESRTVEVAIATILTSYTGRFAGDFKKKKEERTIAANKEETFVLPIPYLDYKDIKPDILIRASFKAQVKETGQLYTDMEDLIFEKPELEAEIPARVNMYKRFQATFFFVNPLPVKLTNAKLNIESHGLNPKSTIKEPVRREIGPHDKVSISVYMEYKRQGRRYLQAVFDSDQLSGIQNEFETFVDL